jgi:hypothetical protein
VGQALSPALNCVAGAQGLTANGWKLIAERLVGVLR